MSPGCPPSGVVLDPLKVTSRCHAIESAKALVSSVEQDLGAAVSEGPRNYVRPLMVGNDRIANSVSSVGYRRAVIELARVHTGEYRTGIRPGVKAQQIGCTFAVPLGVDEIPRHKNRKCFRKRIRGPCIHLVGGHSHRSFCTTFFECPRIRLTRKPT